jgi:hypothetical protein
MIQKYCSVLLVLLLLAGCLSANANAQNKSNDMSLPVKHMLSMLDKIDQTSGLSLTSADEILKVTLQLEAVQSNEYLYIYKGHGGLWKDVELRLPRGGDGRRFVLVLEPNVSIPMSDVMSHYGDVLAFGTSNPNARTKEVFHYVYDRKIGKLTFSFPTFEDPFITGILFDRM